MSLPEHLWRKTMLLPGQLIRDAIANLNESGLQIVLVIDDSSKLLGTVTDGDIRRGLLRDAQIDSPLTAVMRTNSLVVPPEMGREMVVHLMRANKLRQLPVVDGRRRVVGLHLWDEDAPGEIRTNTMVIMAGGLGKRLRPHTETCPKPMLPVAGKPMLEHIIERARDEGVSSLCVGGDVSRSCYRELFWRWLALAGAYRLSARDFAIGYSRRAGPARSTTFSSLCCDQRRCTL